MQPDSGSQAGYVGSQFVGRWLPVAQSISQVAMQLHGMPGASMVLGLLVAVTDPDSSPEGLLRSIKADTSALRMAPLRTAMRALSDARRVGQEHSEWSRYIDRADDELSRARSLASGPNEVAVIEFNHAVVYLLRGDEPNALHHLRLSAGASDDAISLYMRWGYNIIDWRQSNAVKLWPRAARIAMIPTYPVLLMAVGTYTAMTMPKRRRSMRELREFISFYNLIQHTLNSVGGDDPRYLKIQQLAKHKSDGPEFALMFAPIDEPKK
jgi:hypothetical protein